MLCHEARKYLHPFLDNELDVEQNLRVLEHLNLCDGCSNTFEVEKALHALYRTELDADPVPLPLMQRIRDGIRAELDAAPAVTSTRESSGWRAFPAIAAAVAAVLVIAMVFNQPAPVQAATPLMEKLLTSYDAIGDDQVDLVEGDDEAMHAYFEKCGMPGVCLHREAFEGRMQYDSMGGAYVCLDGESDCPSAWTIHRQGERTISHVVLSASARELGVEYGNAAEALGPFRTARIRFNGKQYGVLAVRTPKDMVCLFVLRLNKEDDMPEIGALASALMGK